MQRAQTGGGAGWKEARPREEGGRHMVVQDSGSGNAEQGMEYSDSQAAALMESGDIGMWVVRERRWLLGTSTGTCLTLLCSCRAVPPA